MEKSVISWISQRLQTKQETEKDNQESDSNWLFTYGTSEAKCSAIDYKPENAKVAAPISRAS